MGLTWIRESPPYWDESKAEIVGGAPAGIFPISDRKVGELLPGDWWRVERDGKVAGYGWMDTTFGGDAEILLAVHPAMQGRGSAPTFSNTSSTRRPRAASTTCSTS